MTNYNIWVIRDTNGKKCNHPYYARYRQDINMTFREIEGLLVRYYNTYGKNEVEFEVREVE